MAVIFKTLSATLAANVNEVTFTDSLINSNSVIEVYYNSNDVYTLETWQDGTTIGIVTSDHNFAVGVKVTINNVTSFAPYDDTDLVNQIDGLSDDVSGLTNRIGSAEDDIDSLETRMGYAEDDIDFLETSKQDTLTAGTGITIEDNVISSSSGLIYSESKHKVGVWIDGSDIYAITIHKSNIAMSNGLEIPHNISNLKMAIKVEALCYDESGISFPTTSIGTQYADASSERSLGFRCNTTNLIAYGKNEFSGYTTRHWYFTIFYTENSL